ncbi:MAG: hypothetical protein LC635_04600, partial [Pseudonocardiaceae bacterium]|nr:hypothetical protein [Pseudonocardiaceae bacterium]
TLQRVNAGEWSGNAATVAAGAMQVMRDFDDTMGHHGTTSTLAAFGQSGNAGWARSSVPPVVDARPVQIPSGSPLDVLNATEDYHEQQAAAKDAEERARQVMRDYQTMTTDRIEAMPPLSPAPQVVVAGHEDTITPRPGDTGPGSDGSSNGYVPPRGGEPGDGDTGGGTGGGTAAPRPGGAAQGGPPVPVPPSVTEPSATDPSGTAGTRPPLTPSPVGAAPATVGEPPRPTAAPFVGFGGPGADGGRGPLRGGHPSGGAGPRVGEPGSRGAQPGTGQVLGRGGAASGATRGGAPGMAPFGAPGPGRTDEDKDHQVKYGVPGSEIFEPDHDDGLLHDPFRPGSYVAPASIGDDEDE